MDAIALRVVELAIASIATVRESVDPVLKADRVRLAPEEIQVLLAGEGLDTINRIRTGTGRRWCNGYVLQSYRVRPGATGIVVGRVYQEAQRIIQRKIIQLIPSKHCRVTGCPTAIRYDCRVSLIWGYGARCVGIDVQNINEGFVAAGSC